MNKTLPGIVNPYRKSNFAYIMINIDTDTIGWRKIIKEDKLDFAIHAVDPYDGAAKTVINYNAPGTPCINVADEKGNPYWRKYLRYAVEEDSQKTFSRNYKKLKKEERTKGIKEKTSLIS
jgi:hypothetical protein